MTRGSRALVVLPFVLPLIVAGCSTDDLANKMAEDQGIEINTRGGVPSSFPSEVPLPELDIETAIAVGPGYVLRLTSPDAVADVAAYRATLESAGFEITDAFDNSGGEAHNVGFTATGRGWVLQPVAFTQDTPVDGGYMGLVIDPVSGSSTDGSGTGGDATAGSAPDSTPGEASLLPSSFPADVPLPDLPVQVASEFADGFTAKLTSSAPAADIAAYRATLEALGYTVENAFDHLADDSKNIGFSATGPAWVVHAVAFPEIGDSGGYMAVSIDPAS